MTAYVIQHSFQSRTGLSRDRFVNTFHVQHIADMDDTALAGAANAVKRFYSVGITYTGGILPPLSSYFSGMCFGANSSVKIYRLDDAKPRQPHYEEFYTPVDNSASAKNLPSEVSICMSMHADASLYPGVPIGRLRGRVYMPPLNQTALSETSGANQAVARPNDTVRGLIGGAGKRLFDELAVPSIGAGLVVFSPTASAQSGNLVSHLVHRISVDDAWDTQRRRGERPTGSLEWIMA